MKFGPVPLSQAEGKILGHNFSGPDGQRLLRKGRPLTAGDVALLQQFGENTVYVAELEAGDVDENQAAQRIAQAIRGSGVRLSQAVTGRCNLHSTHLGLLRVDLERLWQLNWCDSVTFSTLTRHMVVTPNQMVATLKMIAYGVPETVVREAEMIGRGSTTPVVWVDPLPNRPVGLILSGAPPVQEQVTRSFVKALRPRLESWGSHLAQVDYVPLENEQGEVELADCLQKQVAAGAELIILAGETAIMDSQDIAPRAIRRAGGRVNCFGAPVDPGNLLLLAWLGSVPVVGAPGCARSPKRNIIDFVIPRLLAGDYLNKADIVQLAHGGMIEDVAERPLPRRKITMDEGNL